MKKLLYVLVFFIGLKGYSQTLSDQATFTIEQLNQLNARLDAQTPFYNTGGGYHGEGAETISGSALFLTEEEAGDFSSFYNWMDNNTPVTLWVFDAIPAPGYGTAPGGSNEVDYPSFAARLCATWSGRSEIVSFAGQTLSKDAHSKRLARALFDILDRSRQDAKLDFSNRSKYPTTQRMDIAPMFYLFSKLSRYVSIYKIIEHQLLDYTPYINNKSAVDTWFANIASWSYDYISWIYGAVFGGLPPYADGVTLNTGSNSRLEYTHYNNSGVGQFEASNMLEATLTNRIMSFIGYLDAYAVNFQNTAYRNLVFELFVNWIELAIIEMTNFELYRSVVGNAGDVGIGYITVQMSEWINIFHSHAVAVTNGLITGESAGKYYDYTTDRGSVQRYTNWATTSTSFPNKNVTNIILDIAKFYRNAANGGYSDIRFARNNGTLPTDGVNKKYTSLFGLANTYLQNSEIDDFVNMRGIYGGPQDSGPGAWPHHGTGVGFGRMALIGYVGATNMTGIFTNTSPPLNGLITLNPQQRATFYRLFYSN